MRIAKETVDHVANLARLNLSEEDKAEMTEKLNSILDYMEKLNELDTTGVQPTAHVIPIKNVFREDKVRESLTLEETLKNAPDRDGNFFRVPRIIEE